jgi:inner membrane protein
VSRPPLTQWIAAEWRGSVRCYGRLARRWSVGAASTACLLVFTVDTLFAYDLPVLPLRALLDESAHVATALLFLRALWTRPVPPFVLSTVLGSILLDLDHVPQTIAAHGDLTGLSRPDSHSLLTILTAVCIARWLPVKWRPYALGLAFGFAMHLVRDMATGSVPLFWPLALHDVHVPYAAYAAVLLASLALVLWRQQRDTSDRLAS